MAIIDELLPTERPLNVHFRNKYHFYVKVVQPLIPDILRIMLNGSKIDKKAVQALEEDVQEKSLQTEEMFRNSILLDAFLVAEYEKTVKAIIPKKVEITFNINSPTHRTALVTEILKQKGIDKFQQSYSESAIKKLAIEHNCSQLASIVDGTFNNPALVNTVTQNLLVKPLAKEADKVAKAKAKACKEEFNPGSSTQRQKFFNYIGVESIFKTDTGSPSYSKKFVDFMLKTLEGVTTYKRFDEKQTQDLKNVIQALDMYSKTSIMRTNFLKTFNCYVYNGYLYPNIKLFGTKTFRISTQKPNTLNFPASGSIYAKPVKKCFSAPEGHVIYQIDLSALEDRIIADLSRDPNKLAVFTEGLDGHLLNASAYYQEDFEAILPRGNYSTIEYIKKLKELQDTVEQIGKLRQNSKTGTFAINYGGGKVAVSAGLRVSEETAVKIIARYNALYAELTRFKEEVIKKAKIDGYLHLGLGCILKTPANAFDALTAFNAVSQFWCVITLLAINKLHTVLTEKDLHSVIKVTGTIHDSVYIQVPKNPSLIKLVNDTMVDCFTRKVFTDSLLNLDCEASIGPNWGETTPIAHNASEEEILLLLKDIK